MWASSTGPCAKGTACTPAWLAGLGRHGPGASELGADRAPVIYTHKGVLNELAAEPSRGVCVCGTGVPPSSEHPCCSTSV